MTSSSAPPGWRRAPRAGRHRPGGGGAGRGRGAGGACRQRGAAAGARRGGPNLTGRVGGRICPAAGAGGPTAAQSPAPTPLP
jgi:hypothetical protein